MMLMIIIQHTSKQQTILFYSILLGRGLGPLIVSWMVRVMGSRAKGYDIAMTAWWLDAFFMALTFFTVEEDEAVARGKKRKRDVKYVKV